MKIVTVKYQETVSTSELSRWSLDFFFFFNNFMSSLRRKLEVFFCNLKNGLGFPGNISPHNFINCIYVQNKRAQVPPLDQCILDIRL